MHFVALGLHALADIHGPLQVRSLPKVAHHDRTLSSIYRRQEVCVLDCGTVSNVLFCETASCVCPILSTAGSGVIPSCESCLKANDYSSDADLLFLGNYVCLSCYNQCSSVLTALITQGGKSDATRLEITFLQLYGCLCYSKFWHSFKRYLVRPINLLWPIFHLYIPYLMVLLILLM